jgi:hypothetical protein
MGVDITIGELGGGFAPLFPCNTGNCTGGTCRECTHEVREEERPGAPLVKTATAQGPKTGQFNFDKCSYGFYARWLDETSIDKQFPALDFKDQPSYTLIPDRLGAVLHQLATDIQMGIVTTKYPVEDAQFTCWMAWWCLNAPKFYGHQAAILFS